MGEFWRERIPSTAVILYALLSGVIPWCIYKLNQLLHHYGDPPWKRKGRDIRTNKKEPAPGSDISD